MPKATTEELIPIPATRRIEPIYVPDLPDIFTPHCTRCVKAREQAIATINKLRKLLDEQRRDFLRAHPRCGDCTILLGPGHVSRRIEVKDVGLLCTSCADQREKYGPPRGSTA